MTKQTGRPRLPQKELRTGRTISLRPEEWAALALADPDGSPTREAARRLRASLQGGNMRPNIQYTVEIGRNPEGMAVTYICHLTEAQAREAALKACRDYPNEPVFVSWDRASDGQHAYLNRDGNHDLTGRDWQVEE